MRGPGHPEMIRYRGSYPAPRFNHGDVIPGYGRVQSRNRVSDGWSYSCNSSKGLGIIFRESDEQAKKIKATKKPAMTVTEEVGKIPLDNGSMIDRPGLIPVVLLKWIRDVEALAKKKHYSNIEIY